MTDRLGEALARWDAGDYEQDDAAQFVAAARSWQTLTNPTDELIDRVADALGPCIHLNCGSDRKQEATRAIKAVLVDALTDTTEPPREET